MFSTILLHGQCKISFKSFGPQSKDTNKTATAFCLGKRILLNNFWLNFATQQRELSLSKKSSEEIFVCTASGITRADFRICFDCSCEEAVFLARDQINQSIDLFHWDQNSIRMLFWVQNYFSHPLHKMVSYVMPEIYQQDALIRPPSLWVNIIKQTRGKKQLSFWQLRNNSLQR